MILISYKINSKNKVKLRPKKKSLTNRLVNKIYNLLHANIVLIPKFDYVLLEGGGC